MILSIAVGAGWSLNLEHSKSLLCDLALSNVDALANSTESGNECEGCASSLYICKYYGNWGGCLGTPYILKFNKIVHEKEICFVNWNCNCCIESFIF